MHPIRRNDKYSIFCIIEKEIPENASCRGSQGLGLLCSVITVYSQRNHTRSQGSIVLVYIVMRHVCYHLNITEPHVKQKHDPSYSEKRGQVEATEAMKRRLDGGRKGMEKVRWVGRKERGMMGSEVLKEILSVNNHGLAVTHWTAFVMS